MCQWHIFSKKREAVTVQGTVAERNSMQGTAAADVQVPSLAPKIDILRKKDVDFYFFTINYSLFTNTLDFWCR